MELVHSPALIFHKTEMAALRFVLEAFTQNMNGFVTCPDIAPFTLPNIIISLLIFEYTGHLYTIEKARFYCLFFCQITLANFVMFQLHS